MTLLARALVGCFGLFLIGGAIYWTYFREREWNSGLVFVAIVGGLLLVSAVVLPKKWIEKIADAIPL